MKSSFLLLWCLCYLMTLFQMHRFQATSLYCIRENDHACDKWIWVWKEAGVSERDWGKQQKVLVSRGAEHCFLGFCVTLQMAALAGYMREREGNSNSLHTNVYILGTTHFSSAWALRVPRSLSFGLCVQPQYSSHVPITKNLIMRTGCNIRNVTFYPGLPFEAF